VSICPRHLLEIGNDAIEMGHKVQTVALHTDIYATSV
jgi:hypothetical protein